MPEVCGAPLHPRFACIIIRGGSLQAGLFSGAVAPFSYSHGPIPCNLVAGGGGFVAKWYVIFKTRLGAKGRCVFLWVWLDLEPRASSHRHTHCRRTVEIPWCPWMMQQWAGVTTIDGVTGGRPIVRCRFSLRGASADPAPRQCRTYPTKIQLRCPAANLVANELFNQHISTVTGGLLFFLPT